jgi:hypothetical protein
VLTFDRRGDEAFPATKAKAKAKPRRKAKAVKVAAASSAHAANDDDDDGAEDDGDNDGDNDEAISSMSSSSSSSSSGNGSASGTGSESRIDSTTGGDRDKAATSASTSASASGKAPLALLIARQLKRTDVRCERAPSIAWPVYQACMGRRCKDQSLPPHNNRNGTRTRSVRVEFPAIFSTVYSRESGAKQNTAVSSTTRVFLRLLLPAC